jgi:hypothetical protein
LTSYVAANGRIDELAIFDHGAPGEQHLGIMALPRTWFQDLAPLLDDHAQIRLLGCSVGFGSAGQLYGDWIADDAAPFATIVAAEQHTWFRATGVVETGEYIGNPPVFVPGNWRTIDGL